MSLSIDDTLRELLNEQGALDAATLKDDSDLYDAGLTSFASVQLMLALEDKFSIEFPERMLNRKTFSTIGNIKAAVRELLEKTDA